MKRAICLAVALIAVMAVAGVASAANNIGLGYYFESGVSGVLTLVGELDLTDKIGFGFDYVSKTGKSETEIYGKLAIKEIQGADFGAFGGVKLVPEEKNVLKLGVYGEQPMNPQITLYGRAGLAFEIGSYTPWLEALGGLRATVMAPIWVGGEAMFAGRGGSASTGFRVLVGTSF